MRTSTVATVSGLLPALAVISASSVRQRRVGRSIRLHQPVKVITTGPVVQAIRDVLAAGHRVRVLESGVIWTPGLDSDGTLTWASRRTPKLRSNAIVEVRL